MQSQKSTYFGLEKNTEKYNLVKHQINFRRLSKFTDQFNPLFHLFLFLKLFEVYKPRGLSCFFNQS
jgi:hypothetical protein